MTVYLDHPLPKGPILAGGKATFDGEMLAEEYKEIVDTVKALEDRREILRALILQAAEDEDPKAKSFPAGQRVIKISHSTRRSVAITEVEKQLPEVFEALVAGGMVKTTESTSVRVD